MAETRITVAWLAALGKFGTSLPELASILDRDGTWLEGKIIVHADGDDVMATLYWDGESEQWLVELGEPETAEDSDLSLPAARRVARAAFNEGVAATASGRQPIVNPYEEVPRG